jgi:hypothetical protein
VVTAQLANGMGVATSLIALMYVVGLDDDFSRRNCNRSVVVSEVSAADITQ